MKFTPNRKGYLHFLVCYLIACLSHVIYKIMEVLTISTAQKIKFSIKDPFIKRDQIRSFLGIWSHLLKKFSVDFGIPKDAFAHKIYI